MLLQTLFVSIPGGANLHFFGSGSILQVKHQRISLNSILTDILANCTGKKTIEEICTTLIKEYSNRPISSFEIEKINDKIINFIECFKEKSFLIVSEKEIEPNFTITGIKGKYCPRKLTIELTNSCNLKCTHCFKEAECKNNHYLDFSVIEDICTKYPGQIYEIQLTGGEPTLHPHIEKIIKKLTKHFRVSLLTNGTELKRIPDDTLQLLSYIQISIYGYNKDVFAKITDTSGRLFDNVGESIKRVRTIRESRVAIVLNSFVINHLEECVLYAIKYLAKEIKFSIASPMGRALKSNQESWFIDKYNQLFVKNELIKLHDKYQDRINVILWEEYSCANEEDDPYNLLNVSLPYCGAGGFDYCITESGMLKTCQILPKIFEMGLYTNLDEIISNGIVNQEQLYHNYAKELEIEGINPLSICPILYRKSTL